MAGDIRYDIGVSVDAALRNLSSLGDKLKKVSEDFDGMAGSARNMAGILAATLTGLATAAASFADEMADVAQANETTIASVLGLSAALQGAGGNADSVGRLFQSLSNSIDAANGGNLKLVDTFNKMGISAKDLGTMGNEEIRNNLIKALADIKDPAERAAKAQEIFGKAALGVDWKAVAADIDENTQKYAQYEANIKLAADAFDTMASLIKDIKIAATVAFEPLFKYLKDMKIDIDVLVTVIRLMAVALAACVSVSVLAGFGKLLTLLTSINSVVSKNKLITVVGALVAVGTAAATWAGLNKEVEDTQAAVNDEIDKTNDKTEKTKRDQTGLLDAIKKQKDALSGVTDSFDRQLQQLKDKVKLEGDALTLSEDQKKINEQMAAIDQQTQNALFSLKQKYDGMDTAARAARAGDYAKEKKLIEDNGAAAKKVVEQQLTDNQRYADSLRNLGNQMMAMETGRLALFDIQAKNQISLAGINDRIALEEKYNAIVRLRTALLNETAGLSESEKKWARDAVTQATSNADLMSKSYEDMNIQIEKSIRENSKLGGVSEETANKIINASSRERGFVIETSAKIRDANQGIADQSRTFEYGWTKAFNEYIDNATNAANIAQNIFKKATQGMEDMIVNFVKTGKFEFKNFVSSMLEELLRSQLRQTMASIFSIGGARGAGASGVLGSLLGFANGGVIPTNQPVLVGERGPEILSGAGGRTVIPNGAFSGSTSVTYNISAVDAMSFKQMIAQDPGFIHAIAMQGGKSTPGRR